MTGPWQTKTDPGNSYPSHTHLLSLNLAPTFQRVCHTLLAIQSIVGFVGSESCSVHITKYPI